MHLPLANKLFDHALLFIQTSPGPKPPKNEKKEEEGMKTKSSSP